MQGVISSGKYDVIEITSTSFVREVNASLRPHDAAAPVSRVNPKDQAEAN
jgi:hypothetical protein